MGVVASKEENVALPALKGSGQVVQLRMILRNVFSNWMAYLVIAVVGLFLTPFVVHHLGNTGYGLWTLVISLTGYFGLLDLGIRSSVGRYVARYLSLNDDERVNRTASTAFAILACGGALAALVTLAVVQFFFGSFNLGPEYQSTGKLALIIAGLNIACVLPLGTFSAVLIALDRFDVLSAISMVGALTRAALIVVFLQMGYGVVTVAMIALCVSLAEYTTIAVLAKSLHRPLWISWRFVDRESMKELLGFGIYRFLWTIANQLIFYTDAVVIGIFLGAGAITYYAIAGSLVNYGRNFVSLLTDTFYPTAARMDALEDKAGLRELYLFSTRMSLLVSLPLCLGFVFLGKQFIVLWMGKDYTTSAMLLLLLTIPQFAGMSQYASALILAGMAKHKILAYISLGEGVANLILSVILVQKMGLAGVALGTVIPHLVSSAVIVPFYTLRVLNLSAREYLTKAFLRPVLCALPTAGLCYGFSMAVEVSWPLFWAEVVLVCAVFALPSFFLCLETGQRALVLGKMQRFLHLESVIHEA